MELLHWKKRKIMTKSFRPLFPFPKFSDEKKVKLFAKNRRNILRKEFFMKGKNKSNRTNV